MPSLINASLAVLIPALVLFHLLAAPYTKVEESFNIQAVHDILSYGIPNPFAPGEASDYIRAHYDHVDFPGAVPRTFVGAAVLSGLTRPLLGFLSSPAQVQTLVRTILGVMNALALVRFRQAVDTAYGRTAGRFYLLFLASQFHVLFYASRPLPNMLAFPLTTEALRAFLLSLSTSPKLRPSSRRRRLSLYLLAAGSILFRAELALLLATLAGTCFLFSRLSLRSELLPALIAAGLIALPLTLGLDTLLWLPRLPSSLSLPWTATWSFPLWPELQGFLFNAIAGHSSEWGTEPWHWYFTSALPRLLLNPLSYAVCIPLSLFLPAQRRTSISVLLPALTFTAVYSLLPHKEWRFVIYIQPVLTAVASGGASWIFTRRSKSSIYALLTLLLSVSIPLSFLASSSLLAFSAHNYPGGTALALLHDLVPVSSPPARVHMDNLSLQTGITRFQELHRDEGRGSWYYDKSENETALLDPSFWEGFDYAVVENPHRAIGAWDVIGSVEAYAGVGLELQGTDIKERKVLFPFHFLPRTEGLDVLHGRFEEVVSKLTGAKWPHMRLKETMWVLKRGSMPV